MDGKIRLRLKIVLASILFFPLFSFASITDGTIDTTYKYAWGENTGWLNFGTTEGNVNITDSILSGYVWSENFGWINLNPTNGGVTNTDEGTLAGSAWGESIGWINFSGVTINSSGEFSGIATGDNSGQVSFDCTNCSVQTDWRPKSTRPQCNNGTDDDGNGSIDYPADPGCSSLDDNEEQSYLGGGSPGSIGTPPGGGESDPPLPPGEGLPEIISPIIDSIIDFFTPQPDLPPTGEGEEQSPQPSSGGQNNDSSVTTGGGEETSVKGVIVNLFSNIIVEAKDSFRQTAKTVQETYKEVKKVVNTPAGEATVKAAIVIPVVVVVGQGLAGAVLPQVFNITDIFSVILRMLGLLGEALGIKKRIKKWGIVFDSITKRPLDPVYVKIIDEQGKIVSERFTDMEGRFGFLVPPGKYRLEAEKTNYSFPTKLIQENRDELYENLYHGEMIDIKDPSVVQVNIPMDPEGVDWNEEIKKKIMSFDPRKEILKKNISRLLFLGGFILSPLVYWITPSPFNFFVVSSYIVILVLKRFGFKPKTFGRIYDKETGKPIAFAQIKVFFADGSGQQVAVTVADITGKYYILVVDKGSYILNIEGESITRRKISTQITVNAPEKIINFNLKV